MKGAIEGRGIMITGGRGGWMGWARSEGSRKAATPCRKRGCADGFATRNACVLILLLIAAKDVGPKLQIQLHPAACAH